MTSEAGEDRLSALDGLLVRLIDDELSGDERARVLELVERDAEVEARLEALAKTSSELSRLLESEPVPPIPLLELPQRARPTGGGPLSARFGWRAAAVAAALVGASLTVQPVRAWLADGAHRLFDVVSPQDASTTPSAAESERVLPSTVSFLPGDGVFTVEVVFAQAGGTLRVEADPARRLVSAAVEGGGTETLVVLPGGLRVANAAESTADYVLRVPSHLASVAVVLDGERVATIDPRAPGGVWSVALRER